MKFCRVLATNVPLFYHSPLFGRGRLVGVVAAALVVRRVRLVVVVVLRVVVGGRLVVVVVVVTWFPFGFVCS